MNNKINSQYEYQNIVLHDLFDIKGGGERLALTLVDALESDLCFGKYNPESFDLSHLKSYELFDLQLKTNFPGLKTISLAQLFKNKTTFLKKYKNVIYSGVICPLAIDNHSNGSNYYYCHTPPRFVYDKYDFYSDQYALPQRLLLKLLVSWFKPKYEAAISLMDLVFTNSQFVRKRVKKYLNRDSVVIYPPCNIASFKYDKAQGYYLSTARLDNLKRIHHIVEAFKKMPEKNLLVCSTGPAEKTLKKTAADCSNIKFTGAVSDIKLRKLISESIATIYIPEDEDFGISPVESMASGKPVICSGHGGPTETVINGETGLYINEDDIIQSLIDNVNTLDSNTALKMRKACQHRAELFSAENFSSQIKEYVLN